MVTRVLDFSRIESGQAAYHLVPTSPAEVVDEALSSLRHALDERKIAVERHVDEGLPRVSADPEALRRAVQNLLDNALKYGGSAGWLGVDVKSEGANGAAEVAVTVADHGKGIRKADVPRIFEPFYRSPEASAGGATGSGLGLALVKHVVDAHGGRMSVRTGPDGTAFTIHLPALAGTPA
jgi:signal transduction histidine kinase